MPAARLALVVPLALTGCSLYAEPEDPPPATTVDAGWVSPPDATLGSCSTSAPEACSLEGASACFVMPTARVSNPDGSAPDLACDPAPVGETAAPVALVGTLHDFESGAPVAGPVEVYRQYQYLAQPVAETVADEEGRWALTIPAGVPTQVRLRTRGTGYIDVDTPQLMLDGSATQHVNAFAVSGGFLEALPVRVNDEHNSGAAVVLVDVRDCNGEPIANAVVTLSYAPHVPGTCPDFAEWAPPYYFDAGTGLPVRRVDRVATDVSGRAMLINVSPLYEAVPYYVQVHGYTAAVTGQVGDLTLLAELEVYTFWDTLNYVVATPGHHEAIIY